MIIPRKDIENLGLFRAKYLSVQSKINFCEWLIDLNIGAENGCMESNIDSPRYKIEGVPVRFLDKEGFCEEKLYDFCMKYNVEFYLIQSPDRQDLYSFNEIKSDKFHLNLDWRSELQKALMEFHTPKRF